MSPEMLSYWEIFRELVSNEELLLQAATPLSLYQQEFIEGPIIDIGCGQSPILLNYATTGRSLYGIDNEQYQLDTLHQRMVDVNGRDENHWHFVNLSFPEQDIPSQLYAVVILSNFLHFYSLEDAKEIINKIAVNTLPGTLIYILVHSAEYYANDPLDPTNNEYFKHYYTKEDLLGLFQNLNFETLYLGEISRKRSFLDDQITREWFDMRLKSDGHTNPEEIRLITELNMKDISEAYIEAIFRHY